MSSLVYIFVLLCLCLHGCNARPFMVVSHKQTHASKLELSVQEVKIIPVAEQLATQGKSRVQHASGSSTSDHDDTNPIYVVEESQDIKGTTHVKIPYSWKILQKASEREVSKRAERSILESPSKPCKKADEETDHVKSSKDKTEIEEEDIAVEDYAQPHRKPPIHNKGT